MYILLNSLRFIYFASDVETLMIKDCRTTLASFSYQYIDSIGCPSKYIIKDGFYSQNCEPYSTAIVWEINKSDNPVNQISCINIHCCDLIT